jgi:hypothetical protein
MDFHKDDEYYGGMRRKRMRGRGESNGMPKVILAKC